MSSTSEKRRASQPGRLSREIFIERSRVVHGDSYVYDQVEFVNTKTKVCIICKKHGPFMQSPEKHMAGNGCPHSECVAERRRKYNLEKYGVEHWSQSEAVKEKKKATMRAKYGVDNPMHYAEFRAKHDDTCMEKYGSASPLGSSEVRQKVQSTMMERHGGIGAMVDPAVRAKSRVTNLSRYGVENPMQSTDIKKRHADAVEANHGVRNVMQVPEFQRKPRESQKVTMLERYGADSGFGSELLRAKAMATNLSNYGVRNVMQLKAFSDKMTASKIANGTTSTSSSEDRLYGILVDVFGVNDVVRQYHSDRYPFACDFYIKSRDMFIELNASWTHGMHWFDSNDAADLDVLQYWDGNGAEHKFYVTAAKVWTERDVVKRQTAADGHLNYVVFWDDDLRDAALWFSMGCPDGADWMCEYSWLPDRRFTVAVKAPTLSGTPLSLSKVAKWYQFDTFYAREIGLWEENPVYRGTTLQVWLYHNRLKYLGKTPEQLSDMEIVRGFTISGILKGYTVFDTALMGQAVMKYGIRSVYDPCAGWGERMLYCYIHGIDYFGVDINADLEDGYARMAADYEMTSQQFVVADSSEYDPDRGFDAVVTCPPYGGTEIYTEHGAENLSEAELLVWWGRVVERSLGVSPKYFCFQVNRKWRDKMLTIVEAGGFELVEEMFFDHERSSHFTRKGGVNTKRERESMLVLRRV